MSLVVAGAGLGGLTAAVALARRGFDVRVFERAPVLSEAGAGVQLSPNATRVLRDLDLLDAIAATAVRPDAVRIRRFRDGVEIARVPLGTEAEARYGAPFLLAHRADVQAALVDAARRQAGLTLTLGEAVTGFSLGGGILHGGILHGGLSAPVDVGIASALGDRRIEAEGLVGADGLRSLVRAELAGAAHDGPRFSGRLAWRSLLPAEAAPRFAREAASQLWLGRHAHLVHYPVRGGALINVVAIVDGAEAHADTIEDWACPGDPARLRQRFAGWHPTAQALIAAATAWRVWPLFDRPPLARWSHGPVTLLGDAAHPALPFLAQGAAQAIEDAAALAAVARPGRPFAEATPLYERRRQAKAARVQRESARQGAVYHLAGPLALARDGAMRLLGPGGMRRRYDWLYGATDPATP